MTNYGFASVDEAHATLAQLGAPAHLIRHTVLVGEAAELLLEAMRDVDAELDAHLVRLGVVFHDAGKIRHPRELAEPGNAHEPAGQAMLLEAGVDATVARCCLSHARWAAMEVSFEELVVALADHLWKGKRNPALEERVIAAAAIRAARGVWDLFVPLDTWFEKIAADGASRLARSSVAPSST